MVVGPAFCSQRDMRASSRSALTLASPSLLDQDIARHTPGCTPGILNLPVIHATQRAIADCQNSMVQLGRTRPCQHTALVKLKSTPVGIDRNRARLLGNRLHHRTHICGLDILVTSDAAPWNPRLTGRGMTDAFLTLVRIARLCADGSELCVLVCDIRVSSVAATVRTTMGAVHKLLLAERHKLSSGYRPSALKSARGREGPA